MGRYYIHNEGKNLQLCYGYDPSVGYFYDIVDLNEKEDSDKFLIEERNTVWDGLDKDSFEKVLEEWGAPREHLLALCLGLDF